MRVPIQRSFGAVFAAALLVACSADRVAEPVAIQLAIQPSAVEVAPGAEQPLTAMLVAVDGRPASHAPLVPAWTSSDTTIVRVTPEGRLQALQPGTADVTADVGGMRAQARVRVRDGAVPDSTSPAPAPSGSALAPDANDRVHWDLQPGLQAATSDAAVRALFDAWNDRPGTLAANFDGRGTNAVRFSWRAVGTRFGDQEQLMLKGFAQPRPRELYLQYKSWLGRTPQDAGGLGAVGAFDLTNEQDPGGNAGAKRVRFLREGVGGGSQWSFDLLYSGPAPLAVHLGAGDPINPASTTPYAVWGNRTAFNPEAHYNQVVTTTLYVRASSAPGVRDGVARVWFNGVLQLERTDLQLEPLAFDRVEFPMVMRSPRLDQTEYWWDIRAWTPVP